MTDTEASPHSKHLLATALKAFAAFAILLGVCGGSFGHSHTPYKWPVIAPSPPMPNPNAFDYDTAAFAMIKDGDIVENGWLTPSPSAIAMGFITRTQSELDRAAADNLPVIAEVRESFNYPYQSPPERSYGDYFPQYGHDRAVARVMLFEALYSAQGGRYDDALAIEMDTIRLGEESMNDESFLGPLVSIACQAIGRRRAWDITDKVSKAAALDSAKRLMAVDDSMPLASRIEQRDEVCTEAKLIEFFRSPNWQYWLAPSYDTGNAAVPLAFWEAHRYDQMKAATVMQDYIAHTDAEIRQLALPYPAFHAASPPKPSSDPLIDNIEISGYEVRPKRETDFTLNELLATKLALHAFYLDTGSYPASLSALVPTYLPRMPIDSFTDGNSPVYRIIPTGYLLYSVGPDAKDDGGKPIFDPSHTGSARYSSSADVAGDIVAGVNY